MVCGTYLHCPSASQETKTSPSTPGQLVAGDLVNSDITVRLQGIGLTQEQTNSFFDHDVGGLISHEWVCELEVQALLNYNKHDGEY